MSSSPHPIHPAFRWGRTCGFTADAPEVEDLPNGDVRVEQWIHTPETGWSREVTTYNPQATAAAMLRSGREVDAWVRRATEGEILSALRAA